jgi:hypothetical protein
MPPTTTERYREKLNNIRLLLNLLKIEALHAGEYRMQDDPDEEDVLELDKIIELLARVYGVFAADEDITTAEALGRAKDLADDAVGETA